MDKISFTLVRNNQVLGRFIGEDNLERSYIEIKRFDNENLNFEFQNSDLILDSRNLNKRYLITSTEPLHNSGRMLKINVLLEEQYLIEKELNYGILKKQFVNYWRNSGFIGSVLTALITYFFIKVFDRFFSAIF